MSDDHQFNEPPKRAPLTPDDIEGALSKAAFAMAFALAEIKCLRASHDALLAAAKPALNVLENLPMGGDRDVNARLSSAIARAEELAP